VEHPCHKCGAAVEDGTPFCKQCGAPQIRVPGVETQEPPAIEPSPPTASASAPELPSLPGLISPDSRPAGVEWAHALPGAALGGAFSLLAAIVPYAIFGPAFLAGGAVAVILYRRHLKNGVPSPGAGAQIGAASGAFGFLFFAIPAVATLVYRPDELRQGMLDNLAHYTSRGYDPQKIQQVQDVLKSPQGLNFFVTFVLFVLFLMFVLGSSIGGALYAAWARKRAQM
jgi:zinc ribbon protein